MVPNSHYFFSNSFNNTNYTNLPLTNRTEQNRERERERAIRTREIDRSIVSIYYYFLLLIYIFRNIELFHIWTQRAEIHRGKVSP